MGHFRMSNFIHKLDKHNEGMIQKLRKIMKNLMIAHKQFMILQKLKIDAAPKNPSRNPGQASEISYQQKFPRIA